jgi:predicted small lipoprotein YifL
MKAMTVAMSPPDRRRRLHAVLLLALLVPLALSLTACGKKSPLDPPPGSEDTSTYPRPYPSR